MQLKELQQIKSISLQCRCFTKRKCHLWTKEGVVVVIFCVVIVAKVDCHRKTSFLDVSNRKGRYSPSWSDGRKHKQSSRATSCGKLSSSYKKIDKNSHFRKTVFLVVAGNTLKMKD